MSLCFFFHMRIVAQKKQMNMAALGGGIFVSRTQGALTPAVTIDGGRFIENEAFGNGGGIFARGLNDTTDLFVDAFFNGNDAELNGPDVFDTAFANTDITIRPSG